MKTKGKWSLSCDAGGSVTASVWVQASRVFFQIPDLAPGNYTIAVPEAVPISDLGVVEAEPAYTSLGQGWPGAYPTRGWQALGR